MRRAKNLFTKLIAISAICLIAQLSFATSVFAVEPIAPQGTSGDLSINVASVAGDRAFAALICNSGPDSIVGLVLDVTATNYDITDNVALPTGFAGSNPSDNGSYDGDTGVWEGEIKGYVLNDAGTPDVDESKPGECVAIGFIGDVTGDIGQTIEFTATILSSTLGDSTPNIDPNDSNDTSSLTSAPIVLDPNLVLETRLLTTGPIVDGTAVSYELTIKNTGEGQFINGGGNPMGVYFILPTGTTFVSVTDNDLSDNLAIPPGPDVCGSRGPVNVGQNSLPAFAGYDAELAGCQILPTSGFVPAGAEYKLTFNMVANGPFSNGDTEVMAILVGDDKDSILLQLAIFTPSTDPFSIDNDNFVYLGFDNTVLRATVDRCAGVGEVVTSNTACFTISFNKEIYAPSFDVSDITVTNGEVDSLVQVGDNLWEIRLKNLVAGQTISVSLAQDNDILDYSAVVADAQVLGINTVRYQVAGTLPETGLDLALLLSALMLLGAGATLLRFSKSKLLKI